MEKAQNSGPPGAPGGFSGATDEVRAFLSYEI